MESTYTGSENLTIGTFGVNVPSLSGLVLQGNARGQSTGVMPDLPRNSTATIADGVAWKIFQSGASKRR
ncbi:MAG: hypothetical protein WC314_15635 [Vulcanimicrobiota bacterium]